MNFLLPRSIELATIDQNLHPRDRTNKHITCDRQTIMGSLWRIRVCLFKKSEACRWRRPSFFFICGSYKNLSLGIHEIDWISSSMVLWCFVDIVRFLMMNILVIMLTIGTYWLYLLHTNLVMLGFLMFFTFVLLINMKLEFDVCFVCHT